MGELGTYRRKRDFGKTAEPEGESGRSPQGRDKLSGGMFCIQKHAARALHYDLRLELDGVLVSWAVPKGPSYDPGTKRLAMHVEDHPVEYGDFEGTIPKGEYGGGTVMLWDTGTWEPLEGDAREGLEKGELKFRLEGERLRGGWVLIHTGGRRDRPENQWLLIKEGDDAARRGEPDPWGPDDQSVSTGRTMEEIAEGRKPRKKAARPQAGADGDGPDGDRAAKSGGAARGSRATALIPSTVPLSLATLVEEPPDGEGWVHEIKYDGYRIAARVDGGDVRLFSRNELDWTGRFKEVATALKGLPTTGTWLDGEVVVFDERGVSDFGRLQRYVKEGQQGDLTYVAFDLLFQDGEDLRGLSLKERKRRLHWLLERGDLGVRAVIRYGDHIEGRGAAVHDEACEQGLEGIVSKRADGPYAGRRTKAWLKSKCARRQEFVVGGFTEPTGSRQGFGALLIGVYDKEGALRFAGRVGSGFNDRTLARLHAQLKKLEHDAAPFADPPRGAQARGVHWVKPRLVAEVRFSEWTGDGQLRHPVFQGLREDKDPAQVVHETEQLPDGGGTTADGDGAPGSGAEGAGVEQTKPPEPSEEKRAAAPAARPSPRRRTAKPQVLGVAITHPDRIVFPDPGLTKLDVAEYYAAVAELMVPYLAQRALTVIRCPDGIGSQCFFQKHVTPSVPKAVSKAKVKGADGAAVVYPVVDTPEGLVAMVQNGAVEFHVWGSRVGAIETPDILVFDLDPSPDVPWRRVREAARTLRDELSDRGLESYLRTSGGKGLHVVVPCTSRAQWPRAGAFAREVVEALVAREPAKYTATMSKAKRGGKVFVDHFRNGRGATSVTSYSLRARPGAPVAVPIAWDELGKVKAGSEWTAERMLRRLRTRRDDPWAGFWTTGEKQKLPAGES
jgi:bifunctional non-homologous end joining protein LigD